MDVNCGISIVTLGVKDLNVSRKFYTNLMGWQVSDISNDNVVFIDAGTTVLSLYRTKALAEDANVSPQGQGFRSVALACNRNSREQVDTLLALASKYGARITQPARDTFWGGYSGCFTDPDQHIWEIAYAPGFKLDKNAKIKL